MPLDGVAFPDRVDYQGVAVLIEWRRTFAAFGARQCFIFTVLKVKSKCPLFNIRYTHK